MNLEPYVLRIAGTVVHFDYSLNSEVLSAFSEEDRIETVLESIPEEEYEYREYAYQTKCWKIADRLDVMGFTLPLARATLEAFATNLVKELTDDASDEGIEPDEALFQTIRTSTFEDWRAALLNVSARIYIHEGSPVFTDEEVLEQLIYAVDGYDVTLRDPFTDDRERLRVLVSAFDPNGDVVFDFTNAVNEGDQDAADALTLTAREKLLAGARTTEKVLVVTEGSSDTAVISKAIAVLFPHLSHLYSFVDHSSFGFSTGTGSVQNLAKAFSGAGVANRVVALLDNDAAGADAMRILSTAGLSPNVRALQLPHLALAENYPTIGPTGDATVDVNGKACAIEMYLGREALTRADGKLAPVQWTGYLQGVKRYQGSLTEADKIAAREKFYARLDGMNVATDPELTDIRDVLTALFHVFN